MDQRKDEGKSIVIISFNYDLCADYAINKLLGEKGGEWDDEVVYFQLFDPTPRMWRERKLKNKNIFLLKPHGSINWYLTKSEKPEFRCFEDWQNKLPNLDFHNKQNAEPVIIPPVLDKFSELTAKNTAGHHGRTWTVMYHSLLKAENWVFVGYSLPPTDFHTNLFLRSAAAFRSQKKWVPKIKVIDPCYKKSGLCDVLSRFFPELNIVADKYFECVDFKNWFENSSEES